MPRLLAMTLILLVSGAQAWAGELAGGPPSIKEVPRELCAHMAALPPTGEADYKPGIAVDGSHVAPADIDGAIHIQPPPVLSFRARVSPIRDPRDRYSRSYIDTVEIQIDTQTGRLFVDGQEIDGAAHAIAEACARQKAY